MTVLVLEASTSAAKAMLYDDAKGVLAMESEAYTTDIDSGGKQDTEQVYLATLRAGKKAAAGHNVSAVAVSGVWHSIAVCDSNMRPVTRTHAWTFTGASDICKGVRADAELATKIYNRTGCMPNVTYQPYTLKYLSDNGLDLSDKLLCSQGGYNFYRMTGERLETACITSGMGLLNTNSRRYDEFVLRYVGIDEKSLGELATFRDTRPLSEACAKELGVAAGIPVVPPHSDGALNQVGNCASKPGIMTFSVGTSAAIRLSVTSPVLSDPPATWCYVGTENWMCGAATAGACNCVNWFKSTVLGDKLSFDELEASLLDCAETPVFLPFLFGERCPGWRDERSGGFEGIRSGTTAPDLFRALCQGVLFNVYQCYRILTDICGQPEQIIMSGGILNSAKWTQMAADIFGREILLSDNAQASLTGGAALALCAAGALKSPDDFNAGNLKAVEPRPEVAHYYRRQYERYLEAFDKGM